MPSTVFFRPRVMAIGVFNLGHGIYQYTPVDNVKRLVDVVKTTSGLHRERTR